MCRIHQLRVFLEDVGHELLLLAADEQGHELAEVAGEDGVEAVLLRLARLDFDEGEEALEQHVAAHLFFVLGLGGLRRSNATCLGRLGVQAGDRNLGLDLLRLLLVVTVVLLVVGGRGCAGALSMAIRPPPLASACPCLPLRQEASLSANS